MHIATPVLGANGSLGEALPVACAGSSCYATSPAAEAALQNLQDLLSRFATTVGMARLTPDYTNGRRVALIGPATLALAKKVAQYLATLYRTADVVTLLGMVGSANDLAKFGATFAQIIAPYAAKLPAVPMTVQTPPIIPTTGSGATVMPLPGPTSMVPPPLVPPTVGSKRNMYIAAGVVAAIGAGTIIYLILKE